MGARQRLTLLAATSGAVLILLGRTAHGAAEQLVQVPPQAWGLSDLSDAVVAGTCTCGALGALWHVVSALLALMALPRANGPSKRCRSGARALAVRVLEAWGAPAVRRIVASALLVSLSSAPALPARRPVAGMTWDGAPPARHPPHRRRSPRRRRRRPISPRRALRQVPATQKAQASQRTRHRRAARRHSPPPTPTPRPPQGPLIPSHPARACGPSPLTSCPPAPPPHRSRRTGRPCTAPTPRPSAPTRR